MTSIPSWITPAGFLFTATELISTTTSVVASGTNISYKLISGSLPSGLSISTAGAIYGSPTAVISTTTNKFVIRASNTGGVADRTFTVNITGQDNPSWSTTAGFLRVGVFNEQYALNNQWVDYQLSATPIEAPTGTELTYYIPANKGRLPPGLVLDRSGKISGFVKDTLTYDGYISDTGNYDDETYDFYPYDHKSVGVNFPGVPKVYQFKVVATDGVTSSERTFKIMISSMEILATNALAMTDAGVTIPLGTSPLQPMQWLNGTDLGVVRAANNQEIAVNVYDPAPYVGTITYSIVTGTTVTTNLPNGLTLDTRKGYIYGYIPYQPAYTRNYKLTVNASKTAGLTTITNINTFTLAVKGEVESTIEWVSGSNLGSIELGLTSELAVVARQIQTDYSIKYALNSGTLPSGLTLERDGNLSGQIAYTENTGTYTFTVVASDVYQLSSIEKQFNLTVTGTTKAPTTIYKTVTTYKTTSTYHSPSTSTKVILLTSGTTWIVPPDFTNKNTIEVWGGGASGSVHYGHQGGGGGGYGKITNLQLQTESTVTYVVGLGGTSTTLSMQDGSPTFFGGVDERRSYLYATAGSGSIGGVSNTGTLFTTTYSTATFAIGGNGGISSREAYNGGGVGGGSSGGSLSDGITGDSEYGVGGVSANITGWGVGGYGGSHTFYSTTSTNNDINGTVFGGGGGAGGTGQGTQYRGTGGNGAILITYTCYGTETTTLVASTTTVSIGQVTYTNNTYTKIYIKPFITQQNRDKYREFTTNLFTFDPKLIYRYFDPNFGIQHNIQVNLEFGIEKINLDEYAIALRENFYRRKFYFGDIKKAIATDSTGSVVYEIVYVDVVDDMVNSKGISAGMSIQNNGTYFPGSIDNMRKQLESIQLQNGEKIKVNEYNEPKFMRTPQAGDYAPPKYIRAIPLCYALPGQGDKIISRIKLSGFDFKTINFEVDRLIVQESADKSTAKYLLLERQALGDTIATDQYLFGPDWWQYMPNRNDTLTEE
jgi:hypothetical protein